MFSKIPIVWLTVFLFTGRPDYRHGGSQDREHPSGAPRPIGGPGRGRDRGSYGGDRVGRPDLDRGGPQKWSSKDSEDRFGDFPGAKIQNSPGGGWSSWGADGGGGGHKDAWGSWGPEGGGADSSKKTPSQSGGGW